MAFGNARRPASGPVRAEHRPLADPWSTAGAPAAAPSTGHAATSVALPLTDDAPRNPIGFALPAPQLPRASAERPDVETRGDSWETPGVEWTDSRRSSFGELILEAPVAAEAPALSAAPAPDAVVPFYRREIGFRRQKKVSPAAEERVATLEAEPAAAVLTDVAANAVAADPKRRLAWRSYRQSGKGQRVVGLKIGASQLAAAVIVQTEEGSKLLQLARRPLARGIVVEGEVRDETALVSELRSFFEENKLPTTNVRLGLSSSRIGVRTIEIADSEDEARFDNAVRFKAHQVLPVALSESMLDYRVISTRTTPDGEEMRRVLLAVAPRDQVEPYQRAAELAGLRLVGADLEAFALLRTFLDPGADPDDTATVVVSVGHDSSTLLVAGAGVPEFTRVFEWGGSTLEDAIAATLEVKPVEAATILRHLSLTGPGRQYDSLDDLARTRATDAVRQRLTPFARELVNSLQFYQTQAESLGIGKILITGGTSHLEGLDAALHQMIGVEVSVGDPLARVLPSAELEPAVEGSIGSLAVPIGLAIEDDASRGVNLLPASPVRTRSTRSSLLKVGLPAAAALPIAVLGLLFAGAHGNVAEQQSQLDALRAEIASLPEQAKPVIEAGVATEEAARATAVASVLGGRLAWDAVFRDMARVLPENVWLTRLSLAEPEQAAPTAPGAAPAGDTARPSAVTIDGYTFTQPEVALLLARLSTLPSLERVTLTSSTNETAGQDDVVHFVIVADLSKSGVSS